MYLFVDMRFSVCCTFLIIVNTASALVNNTQIEERSNRLDVETRRQAAKRGRSTSSSDDDKGASRESQADSLLMSDTISSSGSKIRKKEWMPKSSAERRGWRKWHRKCTPCQEDMRKKWRDPTIKWICGSYQSARRSFKSLCMMHYRNCQDGTMFTKIHEHRCENSTNIKPHGDHFFYEYKVVLTDDSSKSRTDSSTSFDSESSD